MKNDAKPGVTRKQLKARLLRALAETALQDTHALGAEYLFDDVYAHVPPDEECPPRSVFDRRERTVKSLGKEIFVELTRRADRLDPAGTGPRYR